MLVLRAVVRCERRTSLTVNAGCWHALPMGIHAALMLAPRCSPWRPKSEPTTSPDAVTDGGGGADMRRASNRAIRSAWRLEGGGVTYVGRRSERSVCALDGRPQSSGFGVLAAPAGGRVGGCDQARRNRASALPQAILACSARWGMASKNCPIAVASGRWQEESVTGRHW